MESEEEIKNRIQDLEREVNRGWIIYGQFMDAKITDTPDAIEVRELIRKMSEEKAKLVMMVTPSAARDWVNKHKEKYNASSGD